VVPRSSHITVSSRKHGQEQADSMAVVVPAKAESASWRSIGASVISTGVPTSVGAVHPIIGIGIAVLELAVALTVIGTALFGSRELSERAFRLLRWIANRPEPPTPSR
jgi:hypothetical protein